MYPAMAGSLASLIAAIVLGRYADLSWGAVWAIAIAVLGLGALAWRSRRYFWASSLCAAFVAGLLSVQLHKPPLIGHGQEATIGGVARQVRCGFDNYNVMVDVFWPPRYQGLKVYASYPERGHTLTAVGDTMGICGTLQPLDVDCHGVPLEWSMAPYLYTRGASAQMWPRSDDVRIGAPTSAWWVMTDRWRERLRLRLSDLGLHPQTQELLGALLLGQSELLDAETRRVFARAGLSHMVALSGTHVSIIAFIVAWIFLPLRLAWGRRWASAATVIAIWGFVMLVGAPPSMVRAALMASALVLGHLARRDINPLDSLMAAALFILLFDPLALFEPGFQLSFVAVAALVMFAWPVTPRFSSHRWLTPFFSGLTVCVVAVIGTAPLAAWHFHQIPIYFLLANVGAMVVIPLMMGGGILLLVLSFAGAATGWLAVVLNGLYTALWMSATWVAELPGGVLTHVYFPGWVLVFYYGAMIMAYAAMQTPRPAVRHWWVRGAVASLMLGAVSVWCFRPRYPLKECYDISTPWSQTRMQRQGSKVTVTTDAPAYTHNDLGERLRFRYHDYFTSRGVDTIFIRPLSPEPEP